jgi:putative ABC transport system ATP-binding protein
MTLLLQAIEIARRHPSEETWLLDRVSLEIHSGERVVVAGPSGAGKTLLLRAAALLDPLDSGSVLWQTRPILREAVPRYRSSVIYCHQRPAMISATVEEVLRRPFALKIHREKKFNRPWILERLARLRALQLSPQILLLDEPTAALDPKSSTEVEELVVDWINESPTERALVWVSHDVEQGDRIATRKIFMEQGRILT